MTVAASIILTRVRDQLVDSRTVKRWTDLELLRWLSDGQRTIVAANPSASSLVATVTCVAGSRQTIPSDGFALIRVYRNLSAGGVAGDAVTEVGSELLDWQYPDRHSMTGAATIKAYSFDEKDRRAFYVFPPATTAASLQINYSVLPVEMTATTDLLKVEDIYQAPLVDYVLYRAHQKDGDFAGGQQVAAAYLASFTTFIASMGAATPKPGA